MGRFECEQFDNQAGGGTPGNPENEHITPEVQARIDSLVETAKKDAIERTNGNPEAILRVVNAIERRFRPYVTENEIVGQQISSPEYEASIQELDVFLNGRLAAVECDDGRITANQIGAPRNMSVARRLQGMPEVRWSTKNRNIKIINDPEIVSSLKNYIRKQEKKSIFRPHITEFLGPHIFSTRPTRGCGAEIAKIKARGGSEEVEMWDGGINDYFDELGNDGFEAFNNTIRMLGGEGTTFDMTHDIYSQGLIFGLREARTEFREDRTLRENLDTLADDGKILMTERLDARFYQRIMNKAEELGFHDYLDLNDINNFARNSTLINRIAMEITAQEEESGYSWIPQHLIEGKDKRAVRALGFTSVRNSVRRVIGNIRKGDHDLIEHPEQSISIGPIRADYNKAAISFIHHTPGGRHGMEDLADILKLNGLLENSLRNFHHVDFKDEGKVIMTTGIFDRSRYIDDDAAEEAREEINAVVGDNAAKIRDMFSRGVENGEIIVCGCLHEPRTRSLTHIVK